MEEASGTGATLSIIVSFLASQKYMTLKLQPSFIYLLLLWRLKIGFLLLLPCRIVKHTCTETVLTVGTEQNVVVDTALTTLPEILIIGKLRKGNGLVSEFRVDLHHCQTGSKTEDLGVGVTCA